MKPQDIINKIEQNQTKISSFGKFDDAVLKKINYKIRLDWNYNSNRMEGGTLTREETRSVMVDNIEVKGKPFKDVAEMTGHNKVVLDVLKMSKGEIRISEKRMYEIHKAIMHEDDPEKIKEIGRWKTIPNEIINYKDEKNIFTPPSEVAEEVHQLLNRTNAELDKYFAKKESKHPLEIAAQFHIDYINIHPFYDGNGRTARILLNILLMACGYPVIIIKEELKRPYYQLLADIQSYGGKADLFYVFIGERILETQKLVLDALEGKDIEEADDIAKEIEIWKKYASLNKVEGIHRNDELVYELYNNSIQEMFEQFAQKHQQFYDMFQKADCNTYKNSNGKAGIEWLNDEIDKIVLKPQPLFYNAGETPEKIIPDDTFRNIFIQVKLSEYKYGTNAFSVNSSLKFDFELNKYVVHYANKKIEKNYGEFLTADERKEIIVECVKSIFTEIKNKSK